jgi:hypothetical protein
LQRSNAISFKTLLLPPDVDASWLEKSQQAVPSTVAKAFSAPKDALRVDLAPAMEALTPAVLPLGRVGGTGRGWAFRTARVASAGYKCLTPARAYPMRALTAFPRAILWACWDRRTVVA